MDLTTLAQQLIPVVRAAGAEIVRIYDLGVDADFKQDGSPVCAADRAADKVIADALADLAPDIAVVSEEQADSHAQDAPSRFFLVDPLDGTKEFLKRDGKGAYTVNIALIDDGTPVMGLVYAPALDRMFIGVVDDCAYEEIDSTLKPIACRKLPDTGPCAVVSASHRDAKTDAWLAEHKITDTVSIGSSLKFCLLASGEADVYPRFGPTMEWDTAAGDAIVRAAGGIVTHPDGTVFHYGKPGFRNGPFIAKASKS